MNNNGSSLWVKMGFSIIITILLFMGTQMVTSYVRAEDDRLKIRNELKDDRKLISQKFETIIERLARIEAKISK